MKTLRYLTLGMMAICVACMFVQKRTCLRYERNPVTAYELGVQSGELLFVEATGPDITSITWWRGRMIYPAEFPFSGPRQLAWSDEYFGEPPGRQLSFRVVRTIGAGTVALAFAVIWLLLWLASPRKRYSKFRGFEVLPVSV